MTTPTPSSPIRVGTRVEDREKPDPNPAVVITIPDDTAGTHLVEGTDKTVYEFNTQFNTADTERYTESDTVALVAFESDLDNAIDGWTVATPETLQLQIETADIKTYSYPVPRLRPIGETRITPRRTEEGLRYIHRLHITGIGDRLIYADDYDGVDHGAGITREVCFHKSDWDVQKENVIHVEYGREKEIDQFPPLLVDIEQLRVIEQTASPDFLLDL